MSDSENKKETSTELTILAVLGWILPLAGFIWGPGEWWQYLIWLAIGTTLIFGYQARHPE